MAPPAEKRIDADDGVAYTFEELAAFYKGKYKKNEIKAYWETCAPAAKAKAKAKVKAKAKAKVKAQKPKGKKPIAAGDRLPAIKLDFGFNPIEQVDLVERTAGKKVPEYLKNQDKLKEKGVDEVIVYCVNDGAVMKAWAKDQGVEGSIITFMADTRCEFTRKIGMAISHPGPKGALGNIRCKRFVLIVEDSVVKHVEVSEAEGDPAGDNEPEGPVTARTRVDNVLANC